jgi:hypothetical protein
MTKLSIKATILKLVAGSILMMAPALATADTVAPCISEPQLICHVDGILVNSTVYDVTFGNTIDTTFAGDTVGANAAISKISTDLNLLGTQQFGIGDNNPFDDSTYGPSWMQVSIGSGNSAQAVNQLWPGVNGWQPVGLGGDFLPEGSGSPALYAEFSPETPQAPEPATLAMMLGGAALLGLAERKRRTRASCENSLAPA